MKIFIFLAAFLMTAVSSSSFASQVNHMYGPDEYCGVDTADLRVRVDGIEVARVNKDRSLRFSTSVSEGRLLTLTYEPPAPLPSMGGRGMSCEKKCALQDGAPQEVQLDNQAGNLSLTSDCMERCGNSGSQPSMPSISDHPVLFNATTTPAKEGQKLRSPSCY